MAIVEAEKLTLTTNPFITLCWEICADINNSIACNALSCIGSDYVCGGQGYATYYCAPTGSPVAMYTAFSGLT